MASGWRAPLAGGVPVRVLSAALLCHAEEMCRGQWRQRLALYLVKAIFLTQVHVLAESAYEVRLTDAATPAQFQ